jgi:hypothetical protein
MNRDQDLDEMARTIERNHTPRLTVNPSERRRRDFRNALITIAVCVVIAVVCALIDVAIGQHPR